MSNRKRKDILEIASNFEGNLIDYVEKLTKERDLYKSVLNEVREYEESSSFEVDTRDYGRLTVCDADELALILDKVGDK